MHNHHMLHTTFMDLTNRVQSSSPTIVCSMCTRHRQFTASMLNSSMPSTLDASGPCSVSSSRIESIRAILLHYQLWRAGHVCCMDCHLTYRLLYGELTTGKRSLDRPNKYEDMLKESIRHCGKSLLRTMSSGAPL